jgi:hypothetical protein
MAEPPTSLSGRSAGSADSDRPAGRETVAYGASGDDPILTPLSGQAFF